ncbi:hypothetical protein HZ326_12748 [Fusarium oxysporum f. sp. albedinis]|nr:hypothetical protein HZ326_12748 [Fusarium oxysporum f. sp. albedinis]
MTSFLAKKTHRVCDTPIARQSNISVTKEKSPIFSVHMARDRNQRGIKYPCLGASRRRNLSCAGASIMT